MVSKRVLFCFYPAPIHYNYGIALLSRLCKDAGISVSLLMLDTLAEFQRVIVAGQHDLIAFSCTLNRDFKLCESFIELALLHGKKVALGGTFFRRNNPSVFDGRCLICRGEGELLPHYLLSDDTTIFDKQYIHPDIESLPLPDYNLEMRFDGDIPKFARRSMIAYSSSRGCPGQCSFCDVQHQNGNRIRIRRKIETDLQYLTGRYTPEMVFMVDETLPYYDDDWRKSWGDFRYPFAAYIRADILESELLWLIDRGMVGCAFGVESGDEVYRNNVLHKGLLDSDIYRTTRILKQHGKHYIHFYMQGTKGETFLSRKKTYEMSKNLGGFGMIFNYTHIEHNTYGGG
ncbi:MAG: B12-binding domain-containing radical SAM protein [Desulfuromonadaceae bacterium]